MSSDDSSSCEMLSKMKFDVNVVRSLLENPVDIPLVDVQLKLQSVKVFCVCVCVCCVHVCVL